MNTRNCKHKMGYLPLKAMLFLFCISFAIQSYAYVGPGLGAGTIGVVLGLLASIILALFAVFWYPIKRLFKGKKKTSNKPYEKSDIE